MTGKTKAARGPREAAHAAQDRAEEWLKEAAGRASPQAQAAVRWALSMVDEAHVPDVVHGVVVTLTGNRKVANRARKAASRTVRRAERKLNAADRTSGKTLFVSALIAAVVAVAGVLAWRAASSGPESGAERRYP